MVGSKETKHCFENILDADVFPDVSLAELLQDIQTVMLSAAHLQRGHILALYVTELKPKIKNLTPWMVEA